jgi:hypothetical protein
MFMGYFQPSYQISQSTARGDKLLQSVPLFLTLCAQYNLSPCFTFKNARSTYSFTNLKISTSTQAFKYPSQVGMYHHGERIDSETHSGQNEQLGIGISSCMLTIANHLMPKQNFSSCSFMRSQHYHATSTNQCI